MQNQPLLYEPSNQRFVPDFDRVTDLAQTRMERYYRELHETLFCPETEFTTEWQMESTAEEVYLG